MAILEQKRNQARRRKKRKRSSDWAGIPGTILEMGILEQKRNQTRRRNKPKRNQTPQCFLSKLIPDWAGLPGPILESIIDRISLLDCISVSKVCKAWRDVFSPELSCWSELGFPALIMPGQKDLMKRSCFGIIEKRAWKMEHPSAQGKYCWASAREWLVLVDHVDEFYIVCTLLNPFTGVEIKLPKVWDFYHKIVLSGDPTEKGFACMLLDCQSREIMFWVSGASEWRALKVAGEGGTFVDAVFCRQRFFLLTSDGHILWIDVAALSCNSEIETYSLEARVPGSYGVVLRYLVESLGDILLVCRHFNNASRAMLETQNFKVYALKTNEESSSWKAVKNLGDRVLFLEKCSSRSFSASKLGIGNTLKGNRIYFSNDSETLWGNEWHRRSLIGMAALSGINSERKHLGVFRLGIDGDRNGFCFRGDLDNTGPIWFTAPLWWYCNNFSGY